MADSINKFECCTRQSTTSEVLRCSACKKTYHFACIKTTNNKYKELTSDFLSSWLCPACNRPRPGKDNANTPVRALSSHDSSAQNVNLGNRNKRKKTRLSDSDTSTSSDVTLEDVRKVVREELKAILDVFKTSIMTQFGIKLKDISDQLTQVTDSMSFMEQQHEDLKKEVQLKVKSIKTLESENKMLQTNVNDLNARLSLMEQHSRASNVEIQCLPEHKNENLLSLVNQIANTVKYNLKVSDVNYCTRTAKMQKNNQRPKSIIVKFSCPRVRDEFLAAAVNFNRKAELNGDKLNTSHLGLGGDPKPIYITEHLSPTQKALHAAARIKAKELNYKFVWVKRGFIYMRKNESTEYKFIRNMDTLNNLK